MGARPLTSGELERVEYFLKILTDKEKEHPDTELGVCN